MQVSIEAGEGLEQKMTVVMPSDDLDKEVTKRLKDIAKTIKMDGFRPGKVPMRIVKQRFSGHVYQEVMGETIQKTFSQALTQEKVAIVGEPKEIKINESDKAVISYTATYEIMPKIELVDLSSASVELPKSSLVDSDVDDMIEKLREQRMTWGEVDSAAETGNQLIINFKGSIEGEVFDGGEADGVNLVLGSKQMIEGFEDALIGVKKDESRTFTVNFPEDYNAKHLAGKEASFEVLTTAVQKSVLPEIDADFIKAFGVDSENEADLRAEISKNMEFELNQKIKTLTKKNVMDMLIEKHELLIPETAIKSESEALRDSTKENMKQQGQPVNFDMPLSVFEEQAKRRIALGLLMAEITKSAELTLDESRVDALIQEHAESYEDPKALMEYYEKDEKARNSLKNLAMEEQVVDYILTKVQTTDKELSFTELTSTQTA